MHHIKQFVITLAAGIGLAACSNMTPPAKPNTPLPVAWQIRVGKSINEITIHDGMAFVVDQQNRLLALDAKTGVQKWDLNLDLYNDRDNPVGAEGGRVFALMGRESVNVVALDAKTGKKTWAVPLGSRAWTSYPIARDGVVYFEAPANNGKPTSLRAVDASKGAARWEYPINGMQTTISSGPLAGNGLVYIGVYEWDKATILSRRIIAIDAVTGKERWAVPVDLDFKHGMTVDDKHVYAGADAGADAGVVYVHDAMTGEPAQTIRAGGSLTHAPSLANGVLYVGYDDNKLHAFNASDLSPRWSIDMKAKVLTGITQAGGVLYFGTSDGYLHALDEGTGAEKWKTLSPQQREDMIGGQLYTPGVSITPVVADDLLLYYNTDALNALKYR